MYADNRGNDIPADEAAERQRRDRLLHSGVAGRTAEEVLQDNGKRQRRKGKAAFGMVWVC